MNLTMASTANASTGRRYAGRTKMMWEREFMEEAGKTYMGNMTAEEAARQWKEWLNNEDWPRDNEGPRGFLRLEVPIGDFGEAYTEFNSGRSVNFIDKTKRKGKQEDLDDMLNQLVAGHDSMGGVSDHIDKMTSMISSAVAAGREGQQAKVLAVAADSLHGNSAFKHEGMLMADFDQIMDSLTPKKKHSQKDDFPYSTSILSLGLDAPNITSNRICNRPG